MVEFGPDLKVEINKSDCSLGSEMNSADQRGSKWTKTKSNQSKPWLGVFPINKPTLEM